MMMAKVLLSLRASLQPAAGMNAGRRKNLMDRALSRGLIRPKAEKLGPVAKPIARYVVISDLDDQLRTQRFPFAAPLSAPATGPAWRPTGETWRRLQSAKLSGQFWPFLIGDCRGEADMVQQAFRVVQTQQQGADFRSAAQIAKAPDNAIGGPQALDLDHRPLAAQILSVQPLGDNPISSVAVEIIEPSRRLGKIARAWRDDQLSRNRGLLAEGLKRAPSLGKGEAPGEPSGPTSMSNRIRRAGVSSDRRRIRLAAG